jgi:membrane protease YdiL (CAAX protease family)
VLFGLLILSKQAIKPFLLTTTNDLYTGSSLILMFVAALGPIAAPFIEEIVFRHLLVYKFRNHRKAVLIGMVLLSSILFGIMHYVNFNALLPTVPYMIVGAFFCGVYLFFKNIWFSTIIHFLFNAMNALGGAILLLFLSLTQG